MQKVYRYRLYSIVLFIIIMLSVNFFCNISSYDILAYITKNYLGLIYYASFMRGRLGFQLSVKLYIASPRAKGQIQSVNLS
jgi:hypothetical protein